MFHEHCINYAIDALNKGIQTMIVCCDNKHKQLVVDMIINKLGKDNISFGKNIYIEDIKTYHYRNSLDLVSKNENKDLFNKTSNFGGLAITTKDDVGIDFETKMMGVQFVFYALTDNPDLKGW